MKTIKTNSKSHDIVGTLLTAYGVYGIALASAMTLYVIGLGTAVLPGWVGYAAIPCVSAAVFVACKTRDLRGILIGSLAFLPVLYVLGLRESITVDNGTTIVAPDRAIIVSNLVGLLSVLLPIAAFAIAILLPLATAASKKQKQRQMENCS